MMNTVRLDQFSVHRDTSYALGVEDAKLFEKFVVFQVDPLTANYIDTGLKLESKKELILLRDTLTQAIEALETEEG